MVYVLAFFAAIAGAIGGFFAGAAIGSVAATAFGVSAFEGGAGYFAAFVFGLPGGLTGFTIGLWLAFRFGGGHRGFSAIAGRSVIVIVAIVVAATLGVQLRFATSDDFPGGASPQMDFEIRLPANAVITGKQGGDIEMQAGSQRSGGLLRDEWLRRDGDRPVLVGFVSLYTRTSQRMLVVSRPGEPKLLFAIRLSATPATSDAYGDWQRVDFIDDMKADTAPRAPKPTETFDIRYRVPNP
ncbi:MAG: hypothetical protein ACTHLO_17275 [Pseudolabrys sp.]